MAMIALTGAQAKQLQAALALMQQGRHCDALAISIALVGIAANAPDAQQLLGMCQTEAGNAQAAELAFQRALASAGDNPLILLNYAACLRKFGRADAVIKMLERAVRAAPKLARAWTELGVAAIAQARADLARTALTQAASLQPDSAYVWHALGNAHRMADELAAAEDAFQTAIRLKPDFGSAFINLAATQRLLGRSEQAVANFDRAKMLGHTSPDVLDAQVGALMDSAKFAEALRQAREVVRMFPDFVPGHTTLAHIMWEHGSYLMPGHDPWSDIRESLQARPLDHALRLSYASLLLSANLDEAALAQIKILRAHGDSAALATLEADALEKLEQAGAAGKLYDAIYHSNSAHEAAFLNTYVRHLLKIGRWDDAARCALQATQAEPHDQQAWAYLSTAWRLLGDTRELWLCDYERLVAQASVDIPNEFRSESDFLQSLEIALEPLHRAQRAPLQQSVRGGSQTSGRLFGRNQPTLATAQTALKATVRRWLTTLVHVPAHPFLSRLASDVRFSGSWSVRLTSQGKHANHIHQQGWLSSAFYVALPPSITSAQKDPSANPGCLLLGQPPSELKLDLPARLIVRPKPGTLALFPSYFWHGTVPFFDAEPRLSIAFDMQPSVS